MINFPVTVSLFGHSVLIHPILESFGMFIGMRMYFFLKRKQPIALKMNRVTALSVLIGATAGALIGSKVVGNLENPFSLITQPFDFKTFWQNNTIIGGLSFGLLGVEIAKKIIGHQESTGDLMVYPLITAMFIGRIGCFLTGVYEETYGIPTDSIFGLYLGDAYLRHPVALYEMVFLLLLGLGLHTIRKRYLYPSGMLFQLFMLSYFSFRFLLDFIKPHINWIGNIGTIQIVCLIVIIYYIYKLIKTIPLTSKK